MTFTGFWKLSDTERRNLIGYEPPVSLVPVSAEQLSIPHIENYTGYCMQTPVGIVPGCLVNGKERIVTMATEEASVIAACCKASKIIKMHSDGFHASVASARNITEGQILIQSEQVKNWSDAIEQMIVERKESLIQEGNLYCKGMLERGGGVLELKIRKIVDESEKESIVLHLIIDVCESMGANCVNTVTEGLTKSINSLLQPFNCKVLYRIVTNYSKERIVESHFKINCNSWGGENVPLARHIINLNEWAKSDAFRAVTHNKGIFNGITALALATGQDTRAIEAAGHFEASLKNKNENNCYAPLTEYWFEEEEKYFCGKIRIPLMIGTKGGSLFSNGMAVYNLNFMKIEDSQDLATLMASIGLAQNFAALMAIGGEGIQRGHMNLHLRNKQQA